MIFFVGANDLKSVASARDLVSQLLTVTSGFQANIRTIGVTLEATLGEHGFVLTKSFVSLQLKQ